MSRATYQESIRRATILPAFTQDLASVHFHPHADFASLQVFTCDRLSCVLTKEACAANYTRANAPISCKGCPIGHAHAGGQNYRNETGIHANAGTAAGLSCIRCERDAHTATRYIGRFRLVDRSCLCLNCFNRAKEIEKYRADLGGNSKGGVPQKWAHLKQATITIENAAGELKKIDVGLRAGRAECERYVARIHPGCTLVEVFMGGATIPAGATDPKPINWHDEAREKKRTTGEGRKRKTKSLPVASDREAMRNVDAPRPSRAAAVKAVDWDDWDTPLYAKPASDDHSDADGNGLAHRNGWLPPMSEEDDAAYRAAFEEPAFDPESIAAFWDFTADGLPEFVQWLCEGWPGVVIEASTPIRKYGKATLAWDGKTVSELARETGAPIKTMRSRINTTGTPFAIKAGKPFEDITGQRFGNLTAIERTGSDANHHAIWRFACDCGGEVVSRATSVKRGHAVCNCAQKPAAPSAPIIHAAAQEQVEQPHSEPMEPVADLLASIPTEFTFAGSRCAIATSATAVPAVELALASTCTVVGEPIHVEPVQPMEVPTVAAASDEPAQPVTQPVRTQQKPLTGKAARKLEKAQRRVDRQAAAPAPAPEKPTIGKSPRAIAVTARALVQVAFQLNDFQ